MANDRTVARRSTAQFICVIAGPIFLAMAAPAIASEVAAGSLADFQSRHPTCSFITDDCTICARDGDHLACSTAGIACQPGPLRCNGAEPDSTTPKEDPAK